MSKADIYRKAAEIIVRDGKHETALCEGGDELLKRRSAVCAIGACVRAEYELYGSGFAVNDHSGNPYEEYQFTLPWVDPNTGAAVDWYIYRINDSGDTSAEDIALLLKKHAEEIDE